MSDQYLFDIDLSVFDFWELAYEGETCEAFSEFRVWPKISLAIIVLL